MASNIPFSTGSTCLPDIDAWAEGIDGWVEIGSHYWQHDSPAYWYGDGIFTNKSLELVAPLSTYQQPDMNEPLCDKSSVVASDYYDAVLQGDFKVAISQDNASSISDSNKDDFDPRNHPAYKNVTKGPDGLYHCPWKGHDSSCTHQPIKLKVKYNIFVDYHVKPYRCKLPSCAALHFSSRPDLYRHKREHEKTLLCIFKDCKRSHGRGFARELNLNDHMLRWHRYTPPDSKLAKRSTLAKKSKKDSKLAKSSKLGKGSELANNSKPFNDQLMTNIQFKSDHEVLLSIPTDPSESQILQLSPVAL